MQEGRNMTMMMAPSKAVLAGKLGSVDGAAEEAGSPVSAAESPEGAPETPPRLSGRRA